MQRLQASRFELRPSGFQARLMRRFAGTCRLMFNRALAIQRERHAESLNNKSHRPHSRPADSGHWCSGPPHSATVPLPPSSYCRKPPCLGLPAPVCQPAGQTRRSKPFAQHARNAPLSSRKPVMESRTCKCPELMLCLPSGYCPPDSPLGDTDMNDIQETTADRDEDQNGQLITIREIETLKAESVQFMRRDKRASDKLTEEIGSHLAALDKLLALVADAPKRPPRTIPAITCRGHSTDRPDQGKPCFGARPQGCSPCAVRNVFPGNRREMATHGPWAMQALCETGHVRHARGPETDRRTTMTEKKLDPRLETVLSEFQTLLDVAQQHQDDGHCRFHARMSLDQKAG